jgi:hypothetical protein
MIAVLVVGEAEGDDVDWYWPGSLGLAYKVECARDALQLQRGLVRDGSARSRDQARSLFPLYPCCGRL